MSKNSLSVDPVKKISADKTSKVDMIPNSIKTLLSSLEFISMIEKGQKPCFGDMTFVSSTSWFGSWKRLTTGENRKNLLFELSEIIDQAALALEEFQSTLYLPIILENLGKAKIGIENLIQTYYDNPNTVSKLRIFIINIDLILKKFPIHG